MNLITEIAAAATELRKAEEQVETRRAALHALIAKASQTGGVKQVDLTRETGYSRETIRKITRAAERQ
ncbi:hypothetical protein ACIGW0_23600 [Streptomyces bikiniensis]|uniref:Uncharacterized protein n=1 Tax=Streptomyces bikiniensis TaxID=1896 RepID=A0ABW8CXP9_STRBI